MPRLKHVVNQVLQVSLSHSYFGLTGERGNAAGEGGGREAGRFEAGLDWSGKIGPDNRSRRRRDRNRGGEHERRNHVTRSIGVGETGGFPDATNLENEPEPELDEPLEVRLPGAVPVDAAEVRR